MSFRNTAVLFLCLLVCLPIAGAQEAPPAGAPLLIKHSGMLKDRLNRPVGEIVGLTFFIYKDRESGAPLWMETQNVTPGADGSYSTNLGAVKDLPLELFASGETRWLSVQINLPGEEEQPRVQLVSVPFALKAADAETLGGRPLSAFVLTEPRAAVKNEAVSSSGVPGLQSLVTPVLPVSAVSGTGTQNYLPKWNDGAGALVDSRVIDTGSAVGIGTTSPNAPLHVKVSTTTDPVLRIEGANVTDGLSLLVNHPDAVIGFALAGGIGHFTGTAIRDDAVVFGQQGKNLLFSLGYYEKMRIASSGNVGIGTTTPGQKLDVGGNINASGSATASSFSGAGSGLTGLNASNLSSGTVANERTSATSASTGNTIVLRDGSGSFSAGTVTATGFSGSGSGVSNVNAAQLGGQAPSYYAPASALADYVAKSGATMTGALTLPSNGLTVGTSQLVVSGGNVGIGAASSGQKLEVSGNLKVIGTPDSNYIEFPDGSKQYRACSVLYAPDPGAAGRVTPAGAGGAPSACASAAPFQQMLEEQRLQIQRLQAEVANLKQRLDALQPAKQ